MSQKLTILVHPMDGLGHVNACIGMAQTLAQRQHRIVFLINSAYNSQFDKYGFEVRYLYEKPSETSSEDDKFRVAKDSAKILTKSGLLSGKSSREKIVAQAQVSEHPWIRQCYEKMLHFENQVLEVLEEIKPDFILMDHVMIQPAILKSRIPWAFINSANPLPLYANSKLPPRSSGYPTDNNEDYEEFSALTRKAFFSNYERFQTQLYEQAGYKPTKTELELDAAGPFPRSEHLNIYSFPAELDYTDLVPPPANSFRVDAFDYKNSQEEELHLPENFLEKQSNSKLIYVSLGSMGSYDTDLMKRLLEILASTPHRYIVSKGPAGDNYELPAGGNFWGNNTLPQSKILPLVDLVITHGGNNTVTETCVHGKPMIVLPLFADQYDNAQRVLEKKLGLRFNPYYVEQEELCSAIERLVNDQDMHKRLTEMSARIEREQRKVKCAEKIEEIVHKNKLSH